MKNINDKNEKQCTIPSVSKRYSMTMEENQNLIDNLKEGDVIEFYTCCNADRKLLKGMVEYKEQLGWITNVEGKQYEIRNLVDMNVC